MDLWLFAVVGITILLLALCGYVATRYVAPPETEQDAQAKPRPSKAFEIFGALAATAVVVGYAAYQTATLPAQRSGQAVLSAEACSALKGIQPPVTIGQLPNGQCQVGYTEDGPLRLTVSPGVLVSQHQVIALSRGTGSKP